MITDNIEKKVDDIITSVDEKYRIIIETIESYFKSNLLYEEVIQKMIKKGVFHKDYRSHDSINIDIGNKQVNYHKIETYEIIEKMLWFKKENMTIHFFDHIAKKSNFEWKFRYIKFPCIHKERDRFIFVTENGIEDCFNILDQENYNYASYFFKNIENIKNLKEEYPNEVTKLMFDKNIHNNDSGDALVQIVNGLFAFKEAYSKSMIKNNSIN